MREWVVPALTTFIFWGFWGFLPKLTTRFISPLSATLFEVVGGILVGIVVLAVTRFRPDFNLNGLLLALMTGVVGFVGALSYLVAVSRGKVSLVVSFTALYPIFSILLAVLLLKESFSVRQGAGVILGLIAMLMIAL